MAVEDLVSEELLLALEADIRYDHTQCFTLESSEDIQSFLSNAKEVIKRIVENIKKFFLDLTSKITTFMREHNITSKIEKLEKMEKVNPKFRMYKVVAIDTERYAELYMQFIKALNDMNRRPVTRDYAGELENLYNKYVKAVSGMPSTKINIARIVVMNRIVLETIRVVGDKNYPEPRNEVIARYYARAATECGKLCSASARQLADAINSNKMKLFMDDMVRFLR